MLAADVTLVPAALRSWYPSLTAPPGTPPAWLFAPVWTILYVMLGIAGWLVWRRTAGGRALRLWGWQLAASALWAPAFFGLRNPLLAFAVIVILLALIGVTTRRFARLQRVAAGLMLPYLVWVCYAAYLNLGFWWLNPA